MASNANAAPGAATTPETPITVKVTYNGAIRKFKLPLKELNVNDFSKAKVRSLLGIPENQHIKLERFSDSSAAYVVLDPGNPSAYKQLYRAAKAKLKLRIRATVVEDEESKPESSTGTVLKVEEEKSKKTEASPSMVQPKDAPSMFAKDAQTTLRDQFFEQLAAISREREQRESSVPTKEPSVQNNFWQVFCNSCDKVMADTHFHCGICDQGDYDLCQACVDAGKTCPGENHWLIKRSIKDGKMILSTTQTFVPKLKPTTETEKDDAMPGAFKTDNKTEAQAPEPNRTCNVCVRVLPEKVLITCKDCEDYDLCVSCHVESKHGHHPGHTFQPISESSHFSSKASALFAPGRNVRHQAICDGCNSTIYGVRNKCLNCPDWDYCAKCFEGSSTAHPGHRFVPVYGPLTGMATSAGIHYGIYCDGPLCSGKMSQSYIRGTRYKCSICHDTDFCANCEAHPSNTHNQTHPLIKFKTQVRNVTVTTLGETKDGESMGVMGDKKPCNISVNPARTNLHSMSQQNGSSSTLPPYTLKDVNQITTAPVPNIPLSSPPPAPLSQAFGDNKPFRTISTEAPASTKPEEYRLPKYTPNIDSSKLDAHFISDTVTDGTVMPPNQQFVQRWKLHNPGPYPWPAGCQVIYVGGDNMLDVDHSHPATSAALARAQRGSTTSQEIPIGGEYDFVTVLRSPQYEGKYISYWRVKAPDGTPFGHKLWCDIQVVAKPDVHPTNTLADYEMQLLLLEQQNRKRLMMAREEQNAMDMFKTATETPTWTKPAYKAEAKLLSGSHVQTENHKRLSRYRDQLRTIAKQSKYAPKVEKVEAETKTKEEPKEEENLEGSQMIFPKLEKESPVSSTHEDIVADPPAVEQSAPPQSSPPTETETDTEILDEHNDAFETLDNLDFSESEEDEGFLTDEEYDILDASDEEIVEAENTAT